MRLPRRISEILKKKEQFLNDMRSKLENTVLRLQGKLFEQIIEEIIPKLDVVDGRILETANNYRLITELNKVYDTFNIKVVETVLPQINKATQTIAKMSADYYSLTLTDIPKRFDKILESAKTLIDLKIGLREEKIIRGGRLMNMLKTDPQEFQHLLSKAVSSEMTMKDFIGVIKENIKGTEESAGILDRQFRRFAYDTYQQYNAAYNKQVADEFGMKYFIYQGGLVIDSRDFCVCHNDKIFTIEEAELWRTWVPDDCDIYPAGWPKAKNTGIHPSYMDFPGYDPIIDRGGYNCRHEIAFLPDDLAFKKRPDLKEK